MSAAPGPAPSAAGSGLGVFPPLLTLMLETRDELPEFGGLHAQMGRVALQALDDRDLLLVLQCRVEVS